MIRSAPIFLWMATIAAVGCDDDSLWSTSVRELSITRRPGFAPPAGQPTADCPSEIAEDTLSVVELIASSRNCVGDTGSDSLALHAARHAMTQDDLDTLVPLLQRLVIVDPVGCPSDAPSVVLKVTTSTETTMYGDARYACNDGSRQAVDGEALDQVSRALHDLAFRDFASLRATIP